MRDLAYLSMARTYYSASVRLDDNNAPTIDANKLSAAVKYWNRVDVGSEYWLDALFEESWAYFMAGDYPHALGNIHTIESPYFPNSFYPEADILKAVISFTICQYEDATTVVARMKKKYEPIKKELEAVLEPLQGRGQREQFFKFLKDVRAGKANLAPSIRPDRGERALAIASSSATSSTCASSTRRTARFKKAPSSFKNSPLGNDVHRRARTSRATSPSATPATLARDALPAQPRRAQRAPPQRVEDPHRHHRRRAQHARRGGRCSGQLTKEESHDLRRRSSPTKSTSSGRSTASTGATSSASTARSWSRSAAK